METGGSCNGPNRYCVMPSTPGTLENACPSQPPRAIRRSLKARKVGRHKRAETKQRKNNGGRLVGASALHTYSKRDPPLRYPWICSLKTRGFRYILTQCKQIQINFHSQGSAPLFSHPLVCSSPTNYPSGSGPLQLFVQGQLFKCCRGVLL